MAKREDAGVGDLKNQVDKVRAETEAAMRQVQSAEAALAEVKQGETVTPVSSIIIHEFTHNQPFISTYPSCLHSLFFVSCSLFRMSCPAPPSLIFSSLTFFSPPSPLPTPRADAAAKQQHVQALTTSLEKVFSLREKMNSAQVCCKHRARLCVLGACMRVPSRNYIEMQRSANGGRMISTVLVCTYVHRRTWQSCNGKRKRRHLASARASLWSLRRKATTTQRLRGSLRCSKARARAECCQARTAKLTVQWKACSRGY